jgi:hypothetical protein
MCGWDETEGDHSDGRDAPGEHAWRQFSISKAPARLRHRRKV